MDQMGMMDAEGGRLVQRPRRAGGRLAVVVALQNVLVVACLVLTVYVYWDFQNKTSSDDFVHILFDPMVLVPGGNTTLRFTEIASSNWIDLDDSKDKIRIKCSGPYILHMFVCYKSMDKVATQGTLQLQVEGNKTPVSTMKLNTSDEDCRGLYSIAYLRAKEEASLHLYSTYGFKISHVRVGLSYLLGKRCDH